MHEYEIEALIDGIFRRRGASGPAYPSIVAGGANATILHYTANDRPLGADELLLIDAGCRARGLLRRRDAHVPDRQPLHAGRSATCYERRARGAARRDRRRAPRRHARRPPRHRRARALRGAGRARAARGLGRRGGRARDTTSASTCTAPATGSAATSTTSGTTRSATRRARSSRAWCSRSSPASTSRPTPTTSRRAFRGIGIRIEDDVLVTAERRRGAVGRRAEAGRRDRSPARRSAGLRRSRPHGSRHRRSSAHHHALGAQASRLRAAGRPGRGRTLSRDRAAGADRLERPGLAASSSSPTPPSAAVSPTSTARPSSSTRTTPTCGPRSATTICACQQMPRVVDSATYLAEHMHEAPVLVIPCIEGRVENAGVLAQASVYGSILPAAWSFMLALRARGLGHGVDHAAPHVRAGRGEAPRHPGARDPDRPLPGGALHRHRLQARQAPPVGAARALERVGRRTGPRRERPLRAAARPSARRGGHDRPSGGGERARSADAARARRGLAAHRRRRRHPLRRAHRRRASASSAPAWT